MEVTTELRREFRRLRSLMISDTSPIRVWLLRPDDGRVWMTDKYILLDVTDSPAVTPDAPAGGYRLNADKGLVPGGVPMIDLPRWFRYAGRLRWYPAIPTRWSITNSKAKAMLLYVDIPDPIPLAVNESAWAAILAAYPDAELYHAGHGGPFRVSSTQHARDIAYIQPVQIPKPLQRSAALLVHAVSSEHDESQKGITHEPCPAPERETGHAAACLARCP